MFQGWVSRTVTEAYGEAILCPLPFVGWMVLCRKGRDSGSHSGAIPIGYERTVGSGWAAVPSVDRVANGQLQKKQSQEEKKMCQVASEDLLPRALLVLSGARVWTELSGQRPARESNSSFLVSLHPTALPRERPGSGDPLTTCTLQVPSFPCTWALLRPLGIEDVTFERESDVVRMEEGKKEKILA